MINRGVELLCPSKNWNVFFPKLCGAHLVLLVLLYIYISCLVDVKGLNDQQLVEQLQDKVHASLLEYNNNFHPNEPNRFGNILLRLPELRSIGTKSLERLFMLSLTGQIHASNSLSELLHSTKR